MRIKQRTLTDSQSILADLPPLLKRIYRARGIESSTELNKELSKLAPFSLLKGIEQAVNLLETVMAEKQSIVVIGDYDSDGATATAVAVEGLTLLGASHINYLIPNRFDFGYGLSPEIVNQAIERFNPALIITVDSGISNIEGVETAKKAGVQVIITDHHLPSDTLPNADAIVNPNQPGCDFPSKAIAGVGVIFYVLIALRARLRATNYFANHQIPEPNLADLLDLVALGTVADVVPLDTNNRILVYQGLKRIHCGRVRPAIKTLLQVAGKEITKITASDLGFIIAPRLNAAGRLDNMKLGIECLLAKNEVEAYEKATQLDRLNKERRQIEQSMREEAFKALENIALDDLPYGICLFNDEWHEGVIGILASRIKEKYHRPTAIFAKAEQAGELKGSIRSIANIHIRDILQNIASQHPNLMKKFGGHAMAAGLTLNADNLASFKLLFNQELAKQISQEILEQNILTDGSLADDDFNLQIAHQLADAGPWGQGFPEPLFEGIFKIENQRLLKEKHLKLQLKLESGQQLEAIAFNINTHIWPNSTIKKVRLVYKLDINEYMNQQRLQLLVNYLEPLEKASS